MELADCQLRLTSENIWSIYGNLPMFRVFFLTNLMTN